MYFRTGDFKRKEKKRKFLAFKSQELHIRSLVQCHSAQLDSAVSMHSFLFKDRKLLLNL